MPAKKSSGAKKKTAVKKNTASSAKKTTKKQEKPRSARAVHQIAPWIIVIAAVFVVLCLFAPSLTGIFGEFIKTLLLGLFAGGAYAVPFIMVIIAIFWKKDIDQYYTGLRMVFASGTLIFLSVILHGIGGNTENFNVIDLFNDGCSHIGGGAVGGLVGSALRACIGMAGLYIVAIALS